MTQSHTNDIVSIAGEMQEIREDIKKTCTALFRLGKEKAEAEGLYDKAVGITLIKLKNGVEIGIDRHTIKDPPASTAEKIAKGICFQECIDSSAADSQYRSMISNLNGLLARLNSLQSEYRYLEHSPE
jgi:hypothetical protein